MKRDLLRSVGVSLAMTLVTLAALEIVLRVADFKELREDRKAIRTKDDNLICLLTPTQVE